MQNAEGFRKRALEGIKVITYLQEFANVGSLSELPELFRDDNRLAEAAVCPRILVLIWMSSMVCRPNAAHWALIGHHRRGHLPVTMLKW